MGFLLFIGILIASVVFAIVSFWLFTFVLAVCIAIGKSFEPIFIIVMTIVWIFWFYRMIG